MSVMVSPELPGDQVLTHRLAQVMTASAAVATSISLARMSAKALTVPARSALPDCFLQPPMSLPRHRDFVDPGRPQPPRPHRWPTR